MTSLHVGTLGRKTGIHITARLYYVVGLGMRSNVLFTLQTGSVSTHGSATVYVGDLGPGGTHLLQSKNKEQLLYEFKTCWSRTHVGWHVNGTLPLN
jgi:hypothetical protein